MSTLVLTLDDSEREALLARARKQKPKGPPMQLTDRARTIQFLRGVGSRATMSLPAFYLFMGSSAMKRNCSIDGYAGIVFQHSTEFMSCNTVTLCCRKVFDHAKGMTGAGFSRASDVTLSEVAAYWAKSSKRTVEEATAALALLREVFGQCSRSISVLLGDSSTLLGRRVGLLKQHADRTAAHLTLEDHEFSLLDCAHVVAAMVVLGEIVISFDDPSRGPDFLNELDRASHAAAKHLFPDLPTIRLFESIDISAQARGYWKHGSAQGARLIVDQLPYATGWY